MKVNPNNIFKNVGNDNGRMLAVFNFIEKNYGRISDTPTPFYDFAFGNAAFSLPTNQVLYIEETEVVADVIAPNVRLVGYDGRGNLIELFYQNTSLPVVLQDVLLDQVLFESNVQFQTVKGWLFTYEN